LEELKKMYVVHAVTPNDSLNILALRYNVNKDLIRMANDFSGDDIYYMKELIIPFTSTLFLTFRLNRA
jgi:LysM repeat protein